MKNLYLILLLAFGLADAQIVDIPNVNFQQALRFMLCVDTNNDGIGDSDVDTNDDGLIQVSEALAVTHLKFAYNNFTNITGINAFENLESLDCGSGLISALSISNLHQLKSIKCFDNSLYSVDLVGLEQLETLNVSHNEILSLLNLSGLANLKTLLVADGRLPHLDLTHFPLLETVDCANNLIIDNLTVAPGNNLKNFNCSRNPHWNLNDFSSMPNLKKLECYWNQLGTIDVSSLTQLETLICFNSGLTTLDVSNLTNLKELRCDQNQLTSLAFTNATSLEILKCNENNMTTLAVTPLTSLKYLDCSDNQLSALTINANASLETVLCNRNNLTALNLSGLSNLKELACSENQMTALPVANLGQLTRLVCDQNELPTIDLSGLPNLTFLNCGNNNLTELHTGGLPLLDTLWCHSNNISSLDLWANTLLKKLVCVDNNLTELNIAPLLDLEVLSCGANQLTEMDFSNHTKLWEIGLYDNLFTSLDFSQMGGPDGYYNYVLSSNPNLTNINLKNGAKILHQSQHDPSGFNVEFCENLAYICVDEFNMDSVYAPNTEINSYCSFNPGGVTNTVTGSFTLDLTNDGCDQNDYHFPGIRINRDDMVTTTATYTNASGQYTFYVQNAGTFALIPVFEHPYFLVSPGTPVLNFDAIDGTNQVQDFCITPIGIHNDVTMTLIPVDDARPGFDSNYRLVYKNNGNQVISGNITLTFNDGASDLVSASPSVSNQFFNTLIWNYNTLYPLESRSIDFTLNLNSPQESPAVNNGDLLYFDAVINPVLGDETLADNTFRLIQTVVGSYDPNDKTCLEGDFINVEKVGEYLHYVIRFQNSGTAAAENIVVRDMIDTEKYDIGSLQLVGSSHPHATRITGNKVEFIFDGIHLPAETNNEPASHGFVAFKIKTKNTLAVGESVTNTAGIYFDYNFPIVTEPATSTFQLLQRDQFEDASIAVHPNPVKDRLTVSAADKITSIQLYDLQGRLIETALQSEKKVIFDLTKNSAGLYFVKISTEKGTKTQKIIKE